ncbi:hypothetical protein NQ318_005831 [Aromia moschata]|uniref:GTPase-activating protein CdGAPr n=1 Tax=Aromia moschata TaxID=1265417 RepID=A0AAV8YU97_9CUCU|nr:hypothetical protein NQ318_005831 [Aromia moschata]
MGKLGRRLLGVESAGEARVYRGDYGCGHAVALLQALCTEVYDMQISEAAAGAPAPAQNPVDSPSWRTNEEDDTEWFMVQVTSGDACWLIQRNFENFRMLDAQLHQCIYDRKISHLPDLTSQSPNDENLETKLILYLERFSKIADNSVNCGPVLNWLQMDNKGHRLLVPSEESRSINTPAVAAAYSVRRYVSQARDELNLEVGDMISVIDMASPGESMWWRGKRGFQVGFFPQHCVHIIGDKVPRNMPLPPPVVGSLALTPIKPVLRRHGKLITFFRSFILNRPSRRRLKQSGILRERVFGCDLGEHLLNSGHDIPMVLKCCAEFIEANGIVDGIYRLSGVTSNIQKLRNAFDEDRIPNLYTEDILQDIHSVASLLKMYFRELPNPLCTYQLYQSFVNAVQGCSTAIRNSETDHERLLKMREAVQKLPPPHYRTLEYLMRHLARVAKHGSSTGMTTRNVAIVWAPNLLRCEALEVGGVAALQGVGVQAVVTEFLICYADLIFCDHLPNLDHPALAADNNLLSKKCRPNSLAISTPTKLITLEEARSKHLPNKADECNYIEVGGGPKNLPKKYHTIIELPSGARKRGHTKRSPLGWRMFFSKSRNTSQGALNKNRKASTPITINEKSVTESDLTDMKRKLRTVKSAESLTSGHSEPASTEDVLGPLHSLNKPPGPSPTIRISTRSKAPKITRRGSLLDLSEIQLNFELEESEMRIFSEDESLVSSPRIHKETQRRILTRARPEDFSSTANSVNPSPKKQPRVVLSPESLSRKRTRLEDQLSDIQYIDCNTPENVVSTTVAVVHQMPESPAAAAATEKQLFNESYRPKSKSPRNSDNLDKRQSLNLEPSPKVSIPKSFTEMDMTRKYLGPASILTTPTPAPPPPRRRPPTYDSSPTEGTFHRAEAKSPFKTPRTPTYENVLTTISITYRSPPRSSATSPIKSPVSNYENTIPNPEKALIPTSTASLPIQEATQPSLDGEFLLTGAEERPKSLGAIDELTSSKDSTLKANLSSSAVCNTSDQLSLSSFNDQKTLSSNQSSGSNIQYTPSVSSAPYHCIENSERLSPTDLSLSEVVESSTENLTTSHTSLSFPMSPSKNSLSPNVSPTQAYDCSSRDLLTTPLSPTETRNTSDGFSTENLDNIPDGFDAWPKERPTSVSLIEFSPEDAPAADGASSPGRFSSTNDRPKSDETESLDDNAIYQQVKYFRRSIHEVNALLDLENGVSRSEKESEGDDDVYEDVVTNGDGPEAKEGSENAQDVSNSDGKTESVPEVNAAHDVLDGKNEDLEENYDSLESNQHRPCDVTRTKLSTKTDEPPEKIEDIQPDQEPVNVRDLATKFEGREVENCSTTIKKSTENAVLPLRGDRVRSDSNSNDDSAGLTSKLRKFYEKDGLPPCLRARNLKHQLKTRSLDEEEFHREFGLQTDRRRRSFDGGAGYKTNSLPKTLNPPKGLPKNDSQVDSIHIAHSTENVNSAANDEEEEQRKRRGSRSTRRRGGGYCRISTGDRPPRSRRRSARSDDSADSLEEEQPSLRHKEDGGADKKEAKPMRESLKSRAAIFEQNNQRASAPPDLRPGKTKGSFKEPTRQTDLNYAKNVQETREKIYGRTEKKDNVEDLKELDFYKEQEEGRRASRRRGEGTRTTAGRGKDKPSPPYCIKDMKAIFESKSKQ